MNKVHVILVDGMRPDAFPLCGNPYIRQLLDSSLYPLQARTVMPSVTLPCHMSLFHSVDPTRHGTATNTFAPQVRPINGITEQIRPKTSAMFFNWLELRDIATVGRKMIASVYRNGAFHGYEKANRLTTQDSIACLTTDKPDFAFTYLGWTDEAGHAQGWMTPEYLRSIDCSFDCIREMIEATPDYTTIILADHGGHDRTHGTEMPEDMTIPVILHGSDIAPGVISRPVSIKDIAPTVTKLLGCEADPEWEGISIL